MKIVAVSLVAASCIAGIGTRTASAQITSPYEVVESGYNNWFYFNTYEPCAGSLNNTATIIENYTNLPATTGPLFGWDPYVSGTNPTLSGDYYYGTALFVCHGSWGSPATTLTNAGGATLQSIVSGSGKALAAGVYSWGRYGSSSAYATYIDNYGLIDGEVRNNDGTAAGIYQYSLYGGSSVINHTGATLSSRSPYYAFGLTASDYYGPVNFQNNGTVTSTATGGQQGSTAGYGYSVGVDLFSYSNTAAAPITIVNKGNVTGTVTGGVTLQSAYGMFAWAQGGTMSFANSGTIQATSTSASVGAAKGIYCGTNHGAVTFTNSGTVEATAGGAGGWGVGIENDTNDAVTATNTGTISHNNGLGLFVYATGGSGTLTVNNSGSISGGLWGMAFHEYQGNVTVNDSGNVSGAASIVMPRNSSSVNTVNAINLTQLPTITGTMDGGVGSTTLTMNLTGTLQSVNGSSPTGGNDLSFYGLGSSGYITVSGKTYSWKRMTSVQGTIN